jgi:pantoate--beta-alanine ligase
VIKLLTSDLCFETEIITVPTVREESGLAMSSRNELLTPEEREKASVIFRGLKEAKVAFRNGARNASALVEIARRTIESEPLARVDYISAVDADSLEPIEKIDDREVLLSTAVYFGKVRLIDNVVINRRQ